jgi:hypothetical protein
MRKLTRRHLAIPRIRNPLILRNTFALHTSISPSPLKQIPTNLTRPPNRQK